jgi:hypothetical protein
MTHIPPENRPKENSRGHESSFSLNRQAQSLRPAHPRTIRVENPAEILIAKTPPKFPTIGLDYGY